MEGAAWKRWRAIFNPGFSMSNLLSLVSGMVDETSIFCESLAKRSQNGDIFQMKSLTDYLTLDIIGNIVLDVKLKSQTQNNPLADGLRSQIKWLMFGGDVNPLQRWNPLRPIILWYNKQRMNNFIGPHLDERLRVAVDSAHGQGGKTITDLAFKAYLAGKGESHLASDNIDPMFRSFALSQVKLFLFSGHDTTSSSVCYLFYVLANYRDVLDSLRGEHETVFGANLDDAAVMIKKEPSILNKLVYTTAVIKETLRLYPPVSSTRAGEPGFHITDQQGHRFPTDGFMVWANPQTIQRDPKYWPRADELIPERWLVPPTDPLHPTKGAWRPFEYGARNCIGQELAMLEMKIILIMVVRRYDIETVYDELYKGISPDKVKQVYGERGYQIQRAQPSGDLPCRVRLRKSSYE